MQTFFGENNVFFATSWGKSAQELKSKAEDTDNA
jgi:hypothetical protein